MSSGAFCREFLVGVSAENRASAGVAAGDELDVDLELDTEPLLREGRKR